MYLLDANACIKILNDDSPPLVARLRAHRPSEVGLSSVVKAELVYGARKSQQAAANLATLRELFEPFRSYAFDDACAGQYGLLRAELERKGQLIGPYDMMIAATALAHDLTLVTHNVSEFSRVVDLLWEDWESGGSTARKSTRRG